MLVSCWSNVACVDVCSVSNWKQRTMENDVSHWLSYLETLVEVDHSATTTGKPWQPADVSLAQWLRRVGPLMTSRTPVVTTRLQTRGH